jgi:hypothetical protein
MLFCPNRSDLLPPWSEVETAYIAGIIDGEGSIGLLRRGDAKQRKGQWITIQLQISNTNKPIMDWLDVMFGLKKGQYVYANHAGWRNWYSIKLQGNRAYDIILRIRRYLRIKKSQAELVINYVSWRQSIGIISHRFSQQEDEIREKFYLTCRSLNKRGKERAQNVMSRMRQCRSPAGRRGFKI